MDNIISPRFTGLGCALLFLLLTVTGCATHKPDWNARIGNYTFDQAVLDSGPPDKQAMLENGTRVAEWLTQRGYSQTYFTPGYYGHGGYATPITTTSPNYFMRLTFGPEGKLTAWKTFAQ